MVILVIKAMIIENRQSDVFLGQTSKCLNIGTSTLEPHYQLFHAKTGSPCCKNDRIFNGSIW